ncbi:hypothetical protein D9613_007120 [Agrocybe pediades]|uniref:F-box domain-containing protein n=1 Tax=Agrocybe pediades TaxID=84607 RepID=A0A8H4VIF5_9AGAR|nr:hypothetical protein D9613_007120 [Agrocybe pediades]
MDSVKDVPTAQSQVLSNPDLLQHIFERLCTRPDVKSSYGRITAPESRHILQASLVCRSFVEPAMDVLWAYMNSWTVFLKLIPTVSLQREGSHFSTTEVMTKSNLERLLFYGKRVRYLVVMEFSETVSTHIYFFLSQFCRDSHLFPGLKTLYIPTVSRLSVDNHNSLYMLPSPNMNSLHLGEVTEEGEIAAASVLSHVLLIAPFLRELYLDGKFTRLTLSLLGGLSNLQTLDLRLDESILDSDLLMKVSQLPRLETFIIALGKNSRVPSAPASPTTLDSVRNFSICGSADNLCRLLQSLRFVHLDGLRLQFNAESAVPYIQSCLSRCSELGVLSAITEFVVAHVADPEIALMELESAVPLHSFKSIQYLDIPVMSLTKDDIRSRFKQCQGLIELDLRSYQLPTDQQGLVLNDLEDFAQNFKNLNRLAVSLADIFNDNTGGIQALEKSLANPLAWDGHDLEELIILPISTITQHLPNTTAKYTYKEAIIVSQYIDMLFPRLKKLEFPEPTNPWVEQVKALLEAYQGVRNREAAKAL